MALESRRKFRYGDEEPVPVCSLQYLGLFKDDQALHDERLKLWKDFNLCWLALLQRQLDDSKRLHASGSGPAAGQSILPRDSLKNLGDELTRLCDGLEKFGLVDYEMGVWEEEIIGSESTSVAAA